MYIVFTYFTSFTGYEDAIFDFISNLHVQKSKFGRNIYQFGVKCRKKLTARSSWSFFSMSVCGLYNLNTTKVEVTTKIKKKIFTFPTSECNQYVN